VKKMAIYLLVLACCMAVVHADTVTLKDGTILKGKVLMATSSSILFQTEDGKEQRIKAADFDKYTVGEKTDLGTASNATQPLTSVATTQQMSLKPKTFLTAYLEFVERFESEIVAYNKEVNGLTEVQKKSYCQFCKDCLILRISRTLTLRM